MRKPPLIALILPFAFLLASCAEGPFLDTKIEAVRTSHAGYVCYHPDRADRAEIERIAREACWDDGHRQAAFFGEYPLQCRLTAPSQAGFYCIMAQKTRPTDPDRAQAWDAYTAFREKYGNLILPPPDGTY